MGALTISAVDNTTDKITINAHGLANGAGPARIYTPMGGGGAIPGGLAAVTDYWVIVVDANNIKLATSSANALANIPINITSNGTTPLSLLIGLPYTRSRTYVANVGGGTPTPGSQIYSADLNSIQDDWTAIWNLLTGQTETIWGGNISIAGDMRVGGKFKRGTLVRHVSAMAGLQVSGAAMTIDASHDMWVTTNANNVLRIPIPVEEGDRLTLVQCRVADSGTDVLTMKIWKDDFTGTNPSRTQLGSTANSTGATGALETLSSGALTEQVTSSFVQYFAEFTCTFSAGCQIGGLYVTTDRP